MMRTCMSLVSLATVAVVTANAVSTYTIVEGDGCWSVANAKCPGSGSAWADIICNSGRCTALIAGDVVEVCDVTLCSTH